MRLILLASALALAACEPATPVDEAKAPTPEELGQDDPSVPFTPAAVEGPKTYEAFSKTAMSFTPGVLTFTPTPQKSENLPSGAVFAFANGITYETTLSPGGATMGGADKIIDWKTYFIDPSGAPIDLEKIGMYSVDAETIPPGTPNGGFCDKTSFLATYVVVSPGAEDLTIAAFSGDQWPPKDATALCGTFGYSRVH